MHNRVILIGRLGADPELRHSQTGNSIVTFNVATSEYWTDKATGERKDKTEWHRCVCFAPKLSDVIAKNAAKGDMLFIEGKLQTRSYEKDGQKRYTTEVVIDYNGQVRFLTPKKDSGSSSHDEPVQDALPDDDIPF